MLARCIQGDEILTIISEPTLYPMAMLAARCFLLFANTHIEEGKPIYIYYTHSY